mmetsp:Transcript_26989/g.86727  ORF Transcript_26989/g.86727 Transcript_26989/m.86727 type:complete len:202 (+) Transcript_26989:1327-1932(+)
MATSMAYTSCSSNLHSSGRSSGEGLVSTTLLPSMTNCFIWWDMTPSTSLHPYDSAIFSSTAGISALLLPGRTMRRSALAAAWQAAMTLAASPVMGPAEDWATTVWAATAMKPSTCTPRSILMISPSAITVLSSFSGEKWQTAPLAEMQVGKAMPFSGTGFLLYTFPHSSVMKSSPNWQMSTILAPTWTFLITSAIASDHIK